MLHRKYFKLENLNVLECPDIEGLYTSKDGRVFGTDLYGIYEIIPYLNKPTRKWNVKSGYYKFRYNGKIYQLHRILALTYKRDTYKPGLVVDHIDNNSLNNSLDNLQWISPGANVKKAWNSLNEEEQEKYREKYSSAVKAAHKSGKYKEHLEKLHKEKNNGK